MRYGVFRYRKFIEIFETVDDFLTVYNASPIPKVLPEAGNENGADATTLYYMLYARYANSPIASSSEEQFVARLMLTIFQYAPTWAKRLELQNKLRSLSDADLMKGGKAFYNHATNPSTLPPTDSTTALNKIDDQNVTSYLKSKMEGYSMLATLLETDVTREFLDQFEVLFNPLVMPDRPICYCDTEEVEI